jgi:hypothetical protein
MLYRVVDDHVNLGFKVGSGEARQSGWEERVLLRETLRRRPKMSILFHMAAQFDYKAQWLTYRHARRAPAACPPPSQRPLAARWSATLPTRRAQVGAV